MLRIIVVSSLVASSFVVGLVLGALAMDEDLWPSDATKWRE